MGELVRRFRHSRWFWGVLGLAAAAVGLAGGFVAVQYATASSLGEVQPPEGAFIPSSRVVISVGLEGYSPGSGDVVLRMDGRPLAADAIQKVPGAVQATVELREGRHWARLEYTSRNLFSGRLVRSWEFTVDTIKPSVLVESPLPRDAVAEKGAVLALRFREPVEARLMVDEIEAPLDLDGLTARAVLDLSEGEHQVEVKATDQAGNTTVESWPVYADYSAPQVKLAWWPPDPWASSSARLVIETRDNRPDDLSVKATVDGRPLTIKAGELGLDGVRMYSMDTGILAEGSHLLDLTVADRAGNAFRHRDEVLVDSTETFGAKEMTTGALGRDVKTLQDALIRKQLLTGEPSGTFDEATATAVMAFKQARGLPATPVVDAETIHKMLGAIRIDLSERKLYLYDEGRLVQTYPVAVGQPRYPTPTGSYAIISKVYHPTWSPPPSPWASGLEPVPPGPGNPLGTRWMGLSAPHVGIHGTYASGSIGTAASHGCVRMYIRDVEELFELVFVGTPVEIVK